MPSHPDRVRRNYDDADVAERIIERVVREKEYYPQDWNTDGSITFGEWKKAIREVLMK